IASRSWAIRASSARSAATSSLARVRSAWVTSARLAIAPRLFVKVTTRAAAEIAPIANEPRRWCMNHSRTAAASKMKAHKAMAPKTTAADHAIDYGVRAFVAVAGRQRYADHSQ